MDFSEEMIDEILKIFQVESEEIISRLNNNLLSLEKNPNNKDTILLLFRDAHSLKGASRMIGFNNVQTLAHKMEDALGLAKEDKISINSAVVNVLYKTVDFLSELIQKSIQKGQDVYSEDVTKQISILENIESYADKSTEHSDFNQEIFKENLEKINSLIPETLLILMKLEMNKDENLIAKLLSVISELYEIFKNIGLYDIKNLFEDIKVKLEFTIKGSNSLTLSETEEIHQNLNNIITKLASIFELHNLVLIDYHDIVFQKMTDVLPPEVFDKTEPVESISYEKADNSFKSEYTESSENTDLIIVQGKISNLVQNIGSVSEIIEFLETYKKNCTNDDVNNILTKIIEIFKFVSTNEIQINEEIAAVLIQSIEYCDNIIKNISEIADSGLIFQRLEIVQQILDFNKQKTDVEVFINPKEEQSKKITDFSEIFNTGAIKTLRVDSEKLDALINQVNELTITKIKTQKHLNELDTINKEIEEWQKNLTKILNYLKYYERKYTQTVPSEHSNTILTKQLLGLFIDNSRNVQKISLNIKNLHRTIQEDDIKMHMVVDNLNNMVKSVRVLPLATVFHLFGRMVRDIAQEKNKKIDFEIIGSETSADKKIIEEIKTPLIHIIRNAIDHGIETPDERIVLGKNPAGKIVLSAKQGNNKVIIEIIDDGRGINIEKIKEKALQKGFLTQEEINSMTDEQLTNLIFAPGFSTGDEITNISGRGIGLDIVQSKISQLNGKVSVISELNKGCCLQIELPTSMSILKSLLAYTAGQTFAIPIEFINTVLRKKDTDIIFNNNRKTIIFEGENLVLYDLADILNLEKYETANKDKITVVIIQNNNKKIALCVDNLIGEQEILHKKLSAPFYKLKNISGITTLVSGEICLILNIPDIINNIASIKPCTSLIPKQEMLNNRYKILLVDDSITTRTLEKNILTKAGYNIEVAENPLEAFELMKDNRFDLIISDLEMPEMSGLEFLEKLKTDEMFSEIPVIIVSSIINEENKNRAMELGAIKYIIKGDFNQEDFQDTINSILTKQ